MQNKISITFVGDSAQDIIEQMKGFTHLNEIVRTEAPALELRERIEKTFPQPPEVEQSFRDEHDAQPKEAADEPAPKAKRTRKAKDVVKEASPAPEEIEAKTAPAVVVASKEAVQQALQQVNISLGLPEARRILSHFKINRISEIKPDQYKDFIEMCHKAANDAPAANAMFS